MNTRKTKPIWPIHSLTLFLNMDSTATREIRNISTFQAPLELIWKAWTEPAHIMNWWGPAGFTTTIHTMDLQPGGEWKLTLHGPDGKNYANRSIFKEIVPLEKIVFEHFNPHFMTTVLFTSQGEATQLDWSLLFDTMEMFDIVVKTHKADEGQQQNITRLRDYLSQLA